MQLWFTAHFFDLGNPRLSQLTPVNTRYMFTIHGILWAQIYSQMSSLKLTVDQVLVFDWIADCDLVYFVVIRAGLFGRRLKLYVNQGLKVSIV